MIYPGIILLLSVFADKIKQSGDFLDKPNHHVKDPMLIGNMIVTGFLDTDTRKFILVHI